MRIEQTNIEQIKASFAKMQSKGDFLQLLNKTKPLVYGEKAIPFTLKQLSWNSNPKINRNRYTEFKVKKKSGSFRSIHAPAKGLKSIQKTLSVILQCVFEPHKSAMGFVRNKSIVDNARLHVGSRYVYNIDLKDFFPSIDQARIWKCLQLNPFNLNEVRKTDLHNGKECKFKEYRKVTVASGLPQVEIEKIFTVFNFEVENQVNEDHNSELTFDIKDVIEGNHNFKFKNGNIAYRIELFSNKKDEGYITIFHKHSNLEPLREIANKLSNEHEIDDYDYLLTFIVGRFIAHHQFELNKNQSRLKLANLIASLCCNEMEVERTNNQGEWEKVKRNVLPQGAPTSPVITNIVCQRLDHLLTGVAKRFGLKYSRYADDITFSSMHNVYQPNSEFIKELHRIIADQGFHINESKTRLQKQGYRQEVTGLIVNEKVNIQQRYIKQLRMWLYYWERYGYEKASGFFNQQYYADKGNLKNGKPEMASVISGKLDYLKMVKGADNELYLKLKGRFEKLTGYFEPINKIVNVWEKEGIEAAMKLFYKKNDILINKEEKFLVVEKTERSSEQGFALSDLTEVELIDSTDESIYFDDDFFEVLEDED